MPVAEGEFEISMTAATVSERGEAGGLGRHSFEKTFRGDLAAVSQGEMLSQATLETGGRSYVALERVSGTLAGRRGSFALMQSGSLDGKAQDVRMTVSIVPHSGSGGLAGLTGSMTVARRDGVHHYRLDYVLPSPT